MVAQGGVAAVGKGVISRFERRKVAAGLFGELLGTISPEAGGHKRVGRTGGVDSTHGNGSAGIHQRPSERDDESVLSGDSPIERYSVIEEWYQEERRRRPY